MPLLVPEESPYQGILQHGHFQEWLGDLEGAGNPALADLIGMKGVISWPRNRIWPWLGL